jgi:hypothetical protein
MQIQLEHQEIAETEVEVHGGEEIQEGALMEQEVYEGLQG